MITVPREITDEIKQLLSRVGVSESPEYVPCKPNSSAPQNECFPLVEAKVEAEGGELILGWQIWQGQLLVEAEFHAVWKTPSGEYIDITPKPMPFDKILFVVDHNAAYEGKQVKVC